MTEQHWHILKAEEALALLSTSRQGLSDEAAASILKETGLNTIAKAKKYNPIIAFFEKFNSILMYILAASAAISFVTGHYTEAYVVVSIILLTAIMGFIQEFGAEKSVQALSKLTAKRVEVMRSGKRKQIHSELLVPGDIVVLERGAIVPADLRMLECKGLAANESILTGEIKPKYKISHQIPDANVPLSERDNMAYGGTVIMTGSGLGIVTETGPRSELGRISVTLKEMKDEATPLQKKIDKMSARISVVVIIVCVFIFALLITRSVPFYEAILIVSAVAVSGIPESFPLALTLALSSGVKKMAKQSAIVRDLAAVETLGTTTVICTDKTGTLTENRMIVRDMIIWPCMEIESRGNAYEPNAEFKSGQKAIAAESLGKYVEFFRAATLCNNSTITKNETGWALSGEPTEGALIAMARSAGFEEGELRESNPRVGEIPFDPAQKFMVTINSSGKAQYAYMKGAIEKVLGKCRYARNMKGKLTTMTPRMRTSILEKAHKHSSGSLRIIALATKKLDRKIKTTKFGTVHESDMKLLDSGYVFEGMAAMEDPIRQDVHQAISECRAAGIKVIVVTGDHKETARAIGATIGLIRNDEDLVIEGIEIDRMSDDELEKMIPRVAIFARTTPDHKLRIVNALQRRGEIVAMTGDGVNDAPALKKADIGISMGRDGTEVAREASDMVLADDKFSTIVHAVKQGRTIYSNIRRFIYYLIAGNMTEVGLIAFSVLLGLLTPLSAIMVLFINLITSSLPAMGLSLEPTHQKVMRQKPRNPKERLLSSYILLKIVVLVPFMLFGVLSLFYWELGLGTGSLEKARTMAFAALAMFELFHAFNSRALHTTIFNANFFRNKALFSCVAVSLAILLLVIYLPFGNLFLGTVPLGAFEWLVIVLVSSLVVAVSETIKLLVRSEFDEQRRLRGNDTNLE